jgi:hypothetical protein
MAGDKGVSNDEIEVVDFGATGITVIPDSVRINKENNNKNLWIGIIRCKRCRTYINPFVTWADNGRRWRCVLVNSRIQIILAQLLYV